MEPALPKAAFLAAALALLDGGYMIADAVHRFLTGDFFRIDRQLDPWSGIVSGLGGDPLAMGPIFLLVGAAQALAGSALLVRRQWGYAPTFLMALGTLWYLVFGRLSSGVQIALLVASRSCVREIRGGPP